MKNDTLLQVMRHAEDGEYGDEVTSILADIAMAAIDAFDQARENDRAVLLREIDNATTPEGAERIARLLHEYKTRAINLRSAFWNAAELVMKGDV